MWLLLFLLIPHTCICASSVIDLLCSFLYQNVRPQIIFVSKFHFDKRQLSAITFLESSVFMFSIFFSCSSVQSLLRPKNHGWSQKGASLRDNWSFYHYSPTLSNQRAPVKLVSILIRVEILKAQWYKYVAVYRTPGNTITAEPLIIWLYSKWYDISHSHDKRYDMPTTNLKLDVKRRAWDMARVHETRK